MSKGNKFDHTLFGIALAVIFLIVVTAFWVTSSGEGPKDVSNNYEASQYEKSAERRIEATCARLEGVSLSECIIQIEQSERENHRAQKDLRAQRWMAIWAFVMAGTAIGTLIVTAIGLTWIKATLDQSREAVRSADNAVDVTRSIGRAQVRAYAAVEAITISKVPDSMGRFEAEVTLRNTGQSPAWRVHNELHVGFIARPPDQLRGNSLQLPPVESQSGSAKSDIASGGTFRGKAHTPNGAF